MHRQLLILDLDETLAYASEAPLDRPPDFWVGRFAVYRRPFLAEFLAAVSEWFDLAVWSSASEGYVGAMVEALFPRPEALRFVWSCERCTRRLDGEWRREYWVKDLKKVKRAGYPLEKVLAIDDSPEKLERQYGNLVQVRPFLGDPADRELPTLLRFLDRLRGAENVRAVEKRDWRGRFPSG